jgi:UDP-N-acetylglucosamine 2-epimerase (non-hydrolysing)/GDP/UDP-N,N'-diacetylbacillosamine 2-epimerase (hydrolysing)
MNKRKVCVVTGSRAEYGLLYWVMKEIQADSAFTLQLVVTGMHLSPEFGLTYKLIEADGFNIDAKVETLLSSDTSVGVSKSVGLGVIGFADAFDRLQPDIVVVLGDRFEILAASQAALFAKVPIAHIAGGDITEGAFDEAIRHSITKMSHLHFATNKISADIVRQLGENENYIFNVGSPGIDFIQRMALLSRDELEKQLEFTFRSKNIVVTFHPITLDSVSSLGQFEALIEALHSVNKQLNGDLGIIFTKPNADNEGRAIIEAINTFVANVGNAKVFDSLGQTKYLSLLSLVDAVVGNSSSGLYEAPTFKVPTVNIGDRQKGRMQAQSVISCANQAADIEQAILKAFSLDCSETINPYGDGNSATKIKDHIKNIPNFKSLLKKHFFEITK